MASINVWLLEYYDPSLIHCLSLYCYRERGRDKPQILCERVVLEITDHYVLYFSL